MTAPKTQLLGTPGYQPRGLAGSAEYRPQRVPETREMASMRNADGREVDLLPLGHSRIDELKAQGCTVTIVKVEVDERGRCKR